MHSSLIWQAKADLTDCYQANLKTNITVVEFSDILNRVTADCTSTLGPDESTELARLKDRYINRFRRHIKRKP